MPPELMTCSFCGLREKQVKQLIAGPGGYICDGCVSGVRRVLAAADTPVSTAVATIRRVSDAGPAERCSFCGKSHDRVAVMAAAGDVRICDECLDLCDEIVAYNQA